MHNSMRPHDLTVLLSKSAPLRERTANHPAIIAICRGIERLIGRIGPMRSTLVRADTSLAGASGTPIRDTIPTYASALARILSSFHASNRQGVQMTATREKTEPRK